MAILNYTTSIDAEKTISEISKALVKAGANKIVTDYSDQIPCALTFALILNGSTVVFSLPANSEGVYRVMVNSKKIPRSKCTHEQAQRVAWRILKDWVEAQAAIIQAGLATADQVFLPYAITPSGQTVYQAISQGQILSLT